jgi:hypothetical protein
MRSIGAGTIAAGQAKPASASAPIVRAPSSTPDLRPTISPKRNVDAGRPVQVDLTQSAPNRRLPRARA